MHTDKTLTYIGYTKVIAGKRRKYIETQNNNLYKIKKTQIKKCLCGGANVLKKTNKETLEWLKIQTNKSQSEFLSE